MENNLILDEIILYEDELHDCGTTKFVVKVRVMENSFFILSRLFLRVDHVICRIIDHRFYYESSKDYILREYTLKQLSLKNEETSILIGNLDPQLVEQHLKVDEKRVDKIKF